MKQFFKKYAMTLVALVIASVTLMSFGLIHPIQQKLEWHEKQLNGSYSLMPGTPRTEPGNGCAEETEEYCAKGFIPGTAPSTITDATVAVEDRFRPED